ncbi:MAG: 1-(5-phosphoribosyl)-5-[(5-phosphoribosylamino)methylideneamino]imidazole-4-carboxamide isomerase [Omnitrophica WOR_2 bacterium RIFCSPHIGHO2_02_FULL_52_10]|nr:MAG: 1-(5-phosphoribosyl)-5-[(5-phosphoribosylamino)methylideneamino]imidazole-4-carboxamide isomerase [Omnitrophica WOR_2 bacterium RIFCSPHIGHO2_02_FULL_52_10]
MIIFPAIDIKDGKVVRLAQGKFDKVTEYSGSPVATAKTWVRKGAQWLHVVDLDGAQAGDMRNAEIILSIARSAAIPIQCGGGIRTEKQIRTLLDGGVRRVILGTKAIEDRTFLKDILAQWQNRIAVSLDCAHGMVAQRGWTETSNIKAVDLAQELETLGLACLIYTDISRDGMLRGPNIDGLSEIADATDIPLIASGGVSGMDDIRRLMAIRDKGIIGVIVGRAIYEGKLDLTEALELCSQNE